MINFIACDDNSDFLKLINKMIDSVMMNYDMDYKVQLFTAYDDNFFAKAKLDEGYKVFLLDIQSIGMSGIDAARKIREGFEDWNSIIIMVTGYGQYKVEALCSRLFLLDYINKLDDCNNKMRSILDIVVKLYDGNDRALKFEYNHVLKRINYSQIIYIEKEPDSKRCAIRTTYGTEYITSTVNDLCASLPPYFGFVKLSRSLIANKNHILGYSLKDNMLSFDNGEVSFQVSREHKKELRKHDFNRH